MLSDATQPPLQQSNQEFAPPPLPATPDPLSHAGKPKGLGKRARRRTGILPALSYGLAGFALGVAFWHTVGFWHVVSTALFSGPRNVAAAPPPPMTSAINAYQAVPDRPAETGSITTGSITTGAIAQPSATSASDQAVLHIQPQGHKSEATVSGRYPAPPAADTEHCSTFARDNASGEVYSSHCPPDRDLLAEVPAPAREDKAKPLAETGWSTAVEAN